MSFCLLGRWSNTQWIFNELRDIAVKGLPPRRPSVIRDDFFFFSLSFRSTLVYGRPGSRRAAHRTSRPSVTAYLADSVQSSRTVSGECRGGGAGERNDVRKNKNSLLTECYWRANGRTRRGFSWTSHARVWRGIERIIYCWETD